jgi:hypothetical protein
MTDFTDHSVVQQLLNKAQDADHDLRDNAREAQHFLEARDGQWEPSIINKMTGRPRYTFDMCNPVVDQISGEIDGADFDIRIKPAGGDATVELAKTYDGIVRNIESMSNASRIFSQAARNMVATGMAGWRVVADWVDSDSFDQDILIKPISNFLDRVWFDPSAELQDKSDAQYCFVLQNMSKEEYKAKFPEGSQSSVSDDVTSEVYSCKAESITVGEFFYKKPTNKELVLMSNGAVYEVDDKFESVAEELAASGVTEQRRRKRKGHKVIVRLFDNNGWLGEEKETVFEWLPIIPTYANFNISENKTIYRGVVEKLIDSQRVYNYAKSREIEEGALAPRAKFWMTRQQAKSDLDTLRTMNTNANPIQTYTHVDNQPVPYWTGGAQINPGLQATSIDAARSLTVSAGLFSSNMGDNPGLQSGVAIDLQQKKGDNGTIKYFKSQEVAICHTARIITKAIPKVYDTKRSVRVLGEDGSEDMVTLNDSVFDEDAGKIVELNDLSQGQYDVTCSVGAAFRNRQEETIKAITELASLDPRILEIGSDVLLKNIQSPGIDLLADRVRGGMVQNGLIPEEQMTDEEKEKLAAQQAAAAQQPQQPDVAQQIAQAEVEKAQAGTADIISKIQEREQKIQIDALNVAKAQSDELAQQIDGLKKLREAMGVDTIVGPHNQEAYIQQAAMITDSQQELVDESVESLLSRGNRSPDDS